MDITDTLAAAIQDAHAAASAELRQRTTPAALSTESHGAERPHHLRSDEYQAAHRRVLALASGSTPRIVIVASLRGPLTGPEAEGIEGIGHGCMHGDNVGDDEPEGD